MWFLDQPNELLLLQLSFLDVNSIDAAREAYEEIRLLCSDDYLWRKRMNKEFPGCQLPHDEETYRLLATKDERGITERDRVDVFLYLYRRAELTPLSFDLELAVRSRSIGMVEQLLEKSSCPSSRVNGAVVLAIETKSPELVRLFIDRGLYPLSVYTALRTDDEEIERLFLPVVYSRPIWVFKGLLSRLSNRRAARRIERFVSKIEQNGDARIEMAVAAILDDVDGLERALERVDRDCSLRKAVMNYIV